MAPLAFAGQDWDRQLTEAFSGEQTQHLMHASWAGAIFGASVYQGEPLAQLVDRYVTDDLLTAVAREAEKGRLLLVATTDLDTEQSVIWNLGLIAQQGGAKSRRLFRDVLIASVSVPGIFPPMMIRVEQAGEDFEEMHVDGSATAAMFFIPDIGAILPDPLEPLHGGHLYVLVNGGFRTRECVKDGGAVQLRGTLRAGGSIVDRSDRCAGSAAGTASLPAPGRRSVSGRRRARTVRRTGLAPPGPASPQSVTIGG